MNRRPSALAWLFVLLVIALIVGGCMYVASVKGPL
jgi:hypothetical protein